ncbi:rhodanese-related sulfurtransferase [Salsuginibacillus halophilus]|uniref:Rhodanese-related sulfurtransferase n=1 Tax=Salsuginibacillus halophilus TaxID=517424 RepID=A0A2P8HKZ0_9BACI|nr:rhodanese-like domain-containing protein [Salsuginibacillus halophilus]PSL46879.1 rhodanese-related sulfurtransferase [Salsuginibacillus halophilus]
MSFELEGVEQLSNEEVHSLYEESDRGTIFIDVRELEEYTEAHIPGIPLIPMGEMIDIAGELKSDERYVLVCRSGRRSHEVAKFLKGQGIKNVANYEGGMLEWPGPRAQGEEFIVENVSELYKS